MGLIGSIGKNFQLLLLRRQSGNLDIECCVMEHNISDSPRTTPFTWWNHFGYLLVAPVFLFLHFENYFLLCISGAANGSPHTSFDGVFKLVAEIIVKKSYDEFVRYYVAIVVIVYTLSAYLYVDAIYVFLTEKDNYLASGLHGNLLQNDWVYRYSVWCTNFKIVMSLPVIATYSIFIMIFFGYTEVALLTLALANLFFAVFILLLSVKG
jgi:hypothetical protein